MYYPSGHRDEFKDEDKAQPEHMNVFSENNIRTMEEKHSILTQGLLSWRIWALGYCHPSNQLITDKAK